MRKKLATTFHLRKYHAFLLFSIKMRWMIYVAILSLFGVVLLNIRAGSNSDVIHYSPSEEEMAPLTFVFYSAEGETYRLDETTFQLSPFEVQEHGAPSEKHPEKLGKSLLFVAHREMLLWTSAFSLLFLDPRANSWDEELGIQIIPTYKSCQTPWGYTLQHGESVLAYEQDENTYNICKIERRVCRDGKLSGTFDLQSCVLNSQYRYFQEPFEVYNDPRVEDDDSLTQVSVSSSSSSSAQQSSVVVFPKISSGPVVSSPLPEDSGSWANSLAIPDEVVDQTTRPAMNCLTPRGEEVKDGLFVKAYRHKIGTNATPCEVQLRGCFVGTLEGSYQYPSCRMIDEGLEV